jgi:hypothetical protein
MDTVINQHGYRVFVPDEWKTIFPNLFDGKEFRPPKFQCNPQVTSPTYWIERAGGGYGDVVHMLSALEDKVAELQVKNHGEAKITISVPKHHAFLLEQLGSLATIHNSDTWTSQDTYKDVALYGVQEFYDLCCPCADYEKKVGFDVRKSRVEIFYETLKIKSPVRPPRLLLHSPKSPFPKGKKVVGIGLQSTDKWRNWNLDRFYKVATWLQKKGYFVVTIDHTLSLEGIPALSKQPIRDVVRQMAHLDGFIGLDSGLTYVAASLGATTVGLYGETNGHTLLEKHYTNGHAVQVLRKDRCIRPCYLNRGFYCNQIGAGECSTVCLSEVTVERVQQMWETLETYGTIGATRFHKEASK